MRPLALAVVLAVSVAGFVPFFGPDSEGHSALNGVVERGISASPLTARGLRLLPPAPLTSQNTVLAFPAPPIAARAAYLVDMDSGRVLFEKNADARLPMASTTKITTAVLTLQHARLSDMVRVSRAAATIGESTMSLRQGERLSVRDLLYGLLLNSGNDAAVALAEHVGGTEAHFVVMMNALARGLHMTNTHYATPHGLDAPHHFTSARDLATIAMYAMRDATFRRIVSTANYHIPKTKHNLEHYLGNINKALYWYPGVDGVKPGDTDAAGLCQVISDTRNGHRVMAVLLNTPNLATDLRNLLNFGTRDFQWVPSIYAADQPSTTMSGGWGTVSWRYFYGSGHYVRGAFLHYFDAHGGLTTLGFPLTEQMEDDEARTVQYFQNAELIYDPEHQWAYPAPLGSSLARMVAPPVERYQPSVPARPVAALYKKLAGSRIFGAPVTNLVQDGAARVQFFQFGELASVNGVATVVPVGVAALRLKGWLPALGVADSFPPTMDPALAARYTIPVRAKRLASSLR
jgi:D-alanyl-D-alanine carboxypeptidase